MSKYCTNCGSLISDGSSFCVQCGKKTTGEQPAQDQPIQPTPPQPVQQQVAPTPSPAVQPAYTGSSKPKSKSLKKVGAVAVVAILIIAGVYVGFMLGKEEEGKEKSGEVETKKEDYGVVMGRVADTTGSAISDVTVTANGRPVDTNDQGWFSISNVTAGDRVLVEFSRDGYATTQRIVDVESGESNFIEATIAPVDKTDSFSGSVGGTVTTNGGNLNIEANALEDFQGNTYYDNVQVSMTVFDPTDDNDTNAFPGEYLGIDTSGNKVPLKSYGFMDISITDSTGNELQLADGKTATIEIPVPTSMKSEAATMGSCPLWYFDTDTGYWQQEGQGTYDSTSGTFSGTITHFSTWNFDVAYPRAYISGRVVNSAGVPVQDAEVTCWGNGWKYSRWASGETCTASDGTFTRIPVECTVIFKYKASKGGYDSDTYTIPQALDCDEEYDVGDIVLGSVSNAQITLTWGANPRDLDSHLVMPEYDGNGPFHLYYPDAYDEGYGSDFSTVYPHTNLDTDDTSSYGPEVITIFNFHHGTYRYSIRHYAGTGNIETSGAEINVIIQGIGIYRFTPPAGQTDDTNIWRVFDIVVDSSGAITIDPINDYVTGGDESDLLFPT